MSFAPVKESHRFGSYTYSVFVALAVSGRKQESWLTVCLYHPLFQVESRRVLIDSVFVPLTVSGRKQEIIKLTEQLLQAITSGNYDDYT